MTKRSKKNKEKQTPFVLPTDYVIGIGTVAASFSILETYLIRSIEHLGSMDHRVCAAITAHMPTPLRLSVFRSLAELKYRADPALVYEASKIADDYRAIAGERAGIIHAIWLQNEDTLEVERVLTTAREKLVFSFEKKTIDEIKFVVGRITQLVVRLTQFLVVTKGAGRVRGFTKEQSVARTAEIRAQIDARYEAYLTAREASHKRERQK